MIQIRVIKEEGGNIEIRPGVSHFKVTKSLEDATNEFLKGIPEENVIEIDYRKRKCIVTYNIYNTYKEKP